MLWNESNAGKNVRKGMDLNILSIDDFVSSIAREQAQEFAMRTVDLCIEGMANSSGRKFDCYRRLVGHQLPTLGDCQTLLPRSVVAGLGSATSWFANDLTGHNGESFDYTYSALALFWEDELKLEEGGSTVFFPIRSDREADRVLREHEKECRAKAL